VAAVIAHPGRGSRAARTGTGRILRNRETHATATAVLNPAISAQIIATSHALVGDLFEN
jgi:hypothetical protein